MRLLLQTFKVQDITMLLRYYFVQKTTQIENPVYHLFTHTISALRERIFVRSADFVDDIFVIRNTTRRGSRRRACWKPPMVRLGSSTWFDVCRTSSCTTWLSWGGDSGFVVVDGSHSHDWLRRGGRAKVVDRYSYDRDCESEPVPSRLPSPLTAQNTTPRTMQSLQ